MFKAVGILMLISFVAGALISNYAVSKAKDFISGSSTIKTPEIKVTTPIENLPKDFTLPDIDIGKSEYVTIVFPSAKYGEINMRTRINKRC